MTSPSIDPVVVERMVAHLRDCSEAHNIRPNTPDAQRRYDEMKAIVALLPEPVDPDVLEARALGRHWLIAVDDYPSFEKSLLAAIKRGRELAEQSK